MDDKRQNRTNYQIEPIGEMLQGICDCGGKYCSPYIYFIAESYVKNHHDNLYKESKMTEWNAF